MTLTNQPKDYKGKRAALYLRVSTILQEEMYGFDYQERGCRELVAKLGMRLNAERHILKDAYTGMEYFERHDLIELLNMAKHGEIDVVVMWKLDRFGRKGLQREIIREQLKQYGVTILTLDPNEHADDDSPTGEIIRLIYGFKAEQERNDILERTINGKKERARQGKLLGCRNPLYGYAWRSDKPKEKDAYILNPKVIKVDTDGTEWTEFMVVRLVFDMVDQGYPIRGVARYLNENGIPTRGADKGSVWQTATIHQMLTHRFYIGEAAMFRSKDTGKKPGSKNTRVRVANPDEEQIKMPEGVVPPIIDKVQFERIQERLQNNKLEAYRNNKNPHESLLRAGLAKCGYCGANMYFCRHINGRGPGRDKLYYTCYRGNTRLGTCKGCSIAAHTLDDAAWQFVLSIINDPAQVDQKINALRSDDPTRDRRKAIKTKLADTRAQQLKLRKRLIEMNLDEETGAFIAQRLRELAEDEKGCVEELNKAHQAHQDWTNIQEKLTEFHARCTEMRTQLDTPDFVASYEFKREACQYFGIQAVVRRQGDRPRYTFTANPKEIVSALS